MKAVSAEDLKLIPELAHFSIFDLIHPNNDYIVNEFLWELGIDTDKAVEYTASYHRTLSKKMLVSFMFIGEIRTDRQFRLSPFCSVEDRVIASGKKDISLANELSKMQNIAQSEYGGAASDDDDVIDYYDEDETERIEAELAAMAIALVNIRGNQFKKNGTRKLAKDYHESEPVEKKRKKWKRKINKREIND